MDCELILFPVWLSGHWWLAVAEMERRLVRIVYSIDAGSAARDHALQTVHHVGSRQWRNKVDKAGGRLVSSSMRALAPRSLNYYFRKWE